MFGFAITARLRRCHPRFRIAGIIPAALGLVLLAAAVLKARRLSDSPFVESGLFSSRWLLIGLIELELGLGLCLLLGLYPRQARRAAQICFSGFSAVSLHQAFAGKASCSCFGALALRPWYTLLFDLAAVAALLYWRPEPNIRSDVGGTWDRRALSLRPIVLGLSFLLPGILMATAGSHASSPLLAVSPQILDLGEVRAGGHKEATFSVSNPGDVPLAVAQIVTSCDCLKVELPHRVLAPGEEMAGRARVDLRAEPDVAGSLGIEVKGVGESGAILFIALVDVEVRRD